MAACRTPGRLRGVPTLAQSDIVVGARADRCQRKYGDTGDGWRRWDGTRAAAGSTADVLRTLGLTKERKRRRLLARVAWAIVATIVVVSAARMFFVRQAARNAPHYQLERVTRADLRVTVSATGKLQGLNTVEVGAEVTGKILRVLADYNDKVSKGQVLAEIDPAQLRAAVEQERAQLLAAESNIKTAEATLLESKQARARAEEQAKEGLVAQKDLESSQAAAARAAASVASARASAELARASLSLATSRLGKTKIVAPIDGIVLARLIEPGQTVTAGFTTPVLFKVAEDLSKLALYVDIDEADIGHVRETMDASFTVDAYPGRAFASRVVSLRNEPKTSQNIVTYQAVLAVDNEDRALRPGMTATATIVSELLANALVVPNSALRFSPPATPGTMPTAGVAPRADERRVYVLRDQTLAPLAVKTGASDGHFTQLMEGPLQVGSEVVVDVAAQH